ncbi:hypothetical protein AWW68_16100 [Roseivirga spongicola]|uniref:Glycosyltransferase 2-like domain-containing protein n=1 Tax=Roseivirga spongicola TaxID=333140 RepID=A0A150X631_9BACT|nr:MULTISPECIES: hypothetical protein [Roseivirga]KYG74170.1 hypothetical protein AWW68_16100 [Roseivirga spongicola]MBO6495368.1 hypothetical protein [Roseivirga sp.]
MDVTVVIRAAGERTEKLCQYIVEQQVPSSQVFVIHERPFWKAVQKTFEIGISEKRKWTLAVDADILMTDDCILKMTKRASVSGDNLYIYQGNIIDKVFGTVRGGGPHLYNSAHLKTALSFLEKNNQNHRPESDTYKKLASKGLLNVIDKYIYGIHDYYQYDLDYFRKGFFHAHKHRRDACQFLTHWSRNLNIDSDYNILLNGWLEGNKHARAEANINFFNSLDAYQSLKESKDKLEKAEFKQLYEEVNKVIDDYKGETVFRVSPIPKKNLGSRILIKSGKYLISMGKHLIDLGK